MFQFLELVQQYILGVNLSMTELMQILGQKLDSLVQSQSSSYSKQKIIKKMTLFCSVRNLYCYRENYKFFILLNSEFFGQPQLQAIEVNGFLQINTQQNMYSINLKLLDNEGKLLRACSIYQKTTLCQFCNMLSKHQNQICVMCNPLTGQLKLAINYLITQINKYKIEQILQTTLYKFQHFSQKILKIVQLLQLIPQPMNTILNKVAQRMQQCRIQLLGQHKQYRYFRQQQLHHQYFDQFKQQFTIIYNYFNHTRNRIYVQKILQEFKQKLIYPRTLHNRNYYQLQIDGNDKNNRIAIQSLIKQAKKGQIIQNFTIVNNPSIRLQFIQKINEKLQNQTARIQKLSRNYYYSFLRQYICVMGEPQLNKKYIIKKYQQYTKLSKYFKKNKISLSFQTKLNICTQIVATAYTSMSQIKKFQPSYAPKDLNLTQNNQIILQTINNSIKNTITSIQIAQLCYQILYNIKCNFIRQVRINGQIHVIRQYNMIKTIDDGQLKYQGVSIINYWLKKILLDMVNNVHGNGGAGRQEIYVGGNNVHKSMSANLNTSINMSMNMNMNKSASVNLQNRKQNKNPTKLTQSPNIYNIPNSNIPTSSSFSLIPVKPQPQIANKQLQQNPNKVQPLILQSQTKQIDIVKQKKYLQKLLFVLSLALKTYTQIFKYFNYMKLGQQISDLIQ